MSTLRDQVIQRRRLDRLIGDAQAKLTGLTEQANTITGNMAAAMALGERQCVRIGSELFLVERSSCIPNYVDISPLAVVR